MSYSDNDNENDVSEQRGIVCPRCGCAHYEVCNTEPLKTNSIRRRRICRNCGKKIVTYEGISFSPN